MKKSSKKTLSILFTLRLFFYLSVAALLLFHPGIVVSYDQVGLVQWFLIIPFAALIAFLPSPWGKLSVKLIMALLSLSFLSVWAGGFSSAALPPFLAASIAFTLTLLLFHYPRWGKLSALEPFFFAWVCFRLLAFSRAGEDVAGESLGITQFIFVWTAVVFLFHCAVVYFCLYPGSTGGTRGEGVVFALAAFAALALVLVLLPADFIRNTVIDNLLLNERDRMSRPSDWGSPDIEDPDYGGVRRRGRRTLPGAETGGNPSLRELSEHYWPGEGSRRGRGRGSGGEGDGDGEGQSQQQFAVMIVASKFDPVYMGNVIRGRLDPVGGFLSFPDEILNRLPSQRFFVTWVDSEPDSYMERERQEVFSLSTLSQKYFPYRPFAIEPTILSENAGPFRYIHRNVSSVIPYDPLGLLHFPVRDLSLRERSRLAPYLELPLEETDMEVFRTQLDRIMESWEERRWRVMGEQRNEYMEKILAILTGFSDFQYYATFHNDYSIPDLVNFVLNTKEGDCVEFSNTAALLGRFAGIPSRVVTGYVAADSLQTMAHLRGLAAMRSRIPLLREFPFNDMYLVTDAHGHSWTQFYVPDYGWLDFEATAFAIPPPGSGDPNSRDVVIPLLDGNQVFSPIRAFPWRPVLRAMVFLAILAIVCAYTLRYGREAALYFAVQRGGRAGTRSLYLLLLARLAADGKPIKPVSKTAPEYARLFESVEEKGAFADFAALYTELCWRSFSDKAEMDERFELLKHEYRKILAENRRKGLGAFLVRVFSLRGLAYL